MYINTYDIDYKLIVNKHPHIDSLWHSTIVQQIWLIWLINTYTGCVLWVLITLMLTLNNRFVWCRCYTKSFKQFWIRLFSWSCWMFGKYTALQGGKVSGQAPVFVDDLDANYAMCCFLMLMCVVFLRVIVVSVDSRTICHRRSLGAEDTKLSRTKQSETMGI